jgi:RimJ/RimL family protein N-acetyltransferase
VSQRLVTERLALRPWSAGDAEAALGIYGDSDVARWLVPAMEQVPDVTTMGAILERWVAEAPAMTTPAGRWAIERLDDGQVIGGATLLPLSPDDEFEIGWQLHRSAWGNGFATETGLAMARWAFDQGIEQVIAVVRPANSRAEAVVRRIGMEWIGETEKYHDLRLQVYRLRPGDISPRPR